MTPEDQAQLAIVALDDNKGTDIKDIDVTELTEVTDRIIICTATSIRHATALAERVARKLRESGIRPLTTEGANQKDGWVLIDFGDIVVHIMIAATREFYSLEKLWGMTKTAREKVVGED